MRSCRLFVAASIAVLYIAGCGQPETGQAIHNKATKPSVKESISAKFSGATVVWRDENGKPLFDASLSSVSVSQSDLKSLGGKLQNAKVGLYKDGKIVSRMSAGWIEADSTRREIKAYGGVKVLSVENGAVATSERMTWKSKENKVYGSGHVKMTKQNMTINAGTFVSDTSLKNAKLSDVTMIFGK